MISPKIEAIMPMSQTLTPHLTHARSTLYL